MKPSSGTGSGLVCPNVTLKDLLETKKCGKIIGQNKYERTGSEAQAWWKKKFKSLESQSTMPFYNRKNHLESCFSAETMKKLKASGVTITQDWGEEKIDEGETVITSDVQENLAKTGEKPDQEYSNPYLNFFKKSEERARVWRPRTKGTIDSLPLILKAQQLEEKLATEFDEWFKQVGSQRTSEIDKDVILAIFEVLMSYPVATSMSKEIFEVGAVPEQTANYLGFPQRSESNSVQRAIRKDIRAGNLKPMLVAFNKTLPIELRRQPFTEKLKEKWFEYQIRHQDLETMASVWRGITDLHTTQVFINWLLDNPELPIPPFFRTVGIMHYKNLTTLLDMGVEDEEDEEELKKNNTESSMYV